MLLDRSLAPSPTFPTRRYDLIPVCGTLADYVLRVRQTGKSGKTEEGTYLVQRNPLEWSAGVAAPLSFLLLSPSGELYECCLYTAYEPGVYVNGWCSCYAGRTHKDCKHRAALSDALSLLES